MAEGTFHSSSDEDTVKLGKIAGGLLPPGSTVILTGPLGAGKTVFVKGIAKGLHIASPVVSPSYTIAAMYEGTLPLAHIDLYRTGTDEELELLGFDELLNTTGINVIEWGEKARQFLDEDAIRVTIAIVSANERTITISNLPAKLKERLASELSGAEK